MAITIGSRVSVAWDYDSYEERHVTGRVHSWREIGRSVPDCVVKLDERLSTFGFDVPDVPRACSGSFLVLSPRYVGQTWAEDEGTVHVELHETDPTVLDAGEQVLVGPRVASHGVYRRLD